MRKASLFTLWLIIFIDLVGFGILLPNQQFIAKRYGIANVFILTLIGPAYSFFQFIFAPILGRWSDLVGRRPILILSQVGTLAGFLILFASHFCTSWNPGIAIFLLYFSRVLDGASGGNITIAAAYIADVTPLEERAKWIGMIIGSAFGLGFMFGPLIGGVVGQNLGLEYVPITAAVFSLTALLGTIFYLPESLPREQRERAAAGRAFTGLFHAFVDRLFGMRHALLRPVVGMLIMMAFVNSFAFAGMEQTFSLLIQERGHLTDKNASGVSGYIFGGIGTIILVFQGMLTGRSVKAFGERALVTVGPLLIAVGMTLVGTAGRVGPNVWVLVVAGSALLAIGSSLFNPSMQSLISRHAAAHEQGEIMGASQGMASLARAVGPLLAGFLYSAIDSSIPYYVSAGICVVVAAWAVGMGPRLKPPV